MVYLILFKSLRIPESTNSHFFIGDVEEYFLEGIHLRQNNYTAHIYKSFYIS